MYTSILVLALTGTVTAADSAQPTWRTDYSAAAKECATARKPMAVILGTGPKGYDKLVREGSLQAEANQALANDYVCVYIDTTSEAGAKLAQAFEMSSGKGIVISDRSGDKQAFRHEGELGNGDLAGYLKRYGDPSHVVQRTETSTSARSSFYEGASTGTTGGSGAGTVYPSSVYPGTSWGGSTGSSYCPSCSGSSGGGRRGR